MTDAPITPEAVEHFMATALEGRAMTDAPKRIWAEPGLPGYTCEPNEDYTVEYHRADQSAESKLAMAVDIAKRRGDYVPLGTVECRGDKCREPWCVSCCGGDEAEKAVAAIRNQHAKDRATLAELEVKQ
jgi:hypothetical protein